MNRKHSLSHLLVLLLLSLSAQAQQGLKAEYYNGTNFEQFVASRIDENIDFYWRDTPPVPGLNPNVCSVRWTGKLQAPESGTFTFSARVDDGIRVWVGGVQVIDDWNLNDVGRFSGDIELEEGKEYDLKVEFFNALVEAEITLLWKLPSMKSYFGSWFDEAAKVVGPEFLYRTPEPVPPQITASAAPDPPPPAVAPKPKPPVPKKKTPKPKPPSETVVSADTLERYIPKNIEFEQAESTFLPASYAELDNLADFLNRNPEYDIRIEGHTDVAGDPAKNWQLSERRAYAVASYLVKKGIGAERIEAKGYGSSKPLVKSDGKTYHPENRRVAFIIR